jgi:hypothetical protein
MAADGWVGGQLIDRLAEPEAAFAVGARLERYRSAAGRPTQVGEQDLFSQGGIAEDSKRLEDTSTCRRDVPSNRRKHALKWHRSWLPTNQGEGNRCIGASDARRIGGGTARSSAKCQRVHPG